MIKPYLMGFNFHTDDIETFDVIIVGTGIAGLYTALNLSPEYSVLMVTKGTARESNSFMAQGGIAAAMQDEDIEHHIRDTIIAGSEYNDPEAVEILIKEARKNIETLLKWGVTFNQNKEGAFEFGKEGGHSTRRILHHQDETGREIIEKLINRARQQPNIHITENTMVLDILRHQNRACGLLLFKDKKPVCVAGRHIVMASGGAGRVFKNTTNPPVTTGDGIAMAYRAGVTLDDMEFTQFHPTVFHSQHSDHHFLISEALRGEGAHLVNDTGERFMHKYHPSLELAPRDVVARSIHKESEAGRRIYLDITHATHSSIVAHFPAIYRYCLDEGIDIARQWIPVTPAQHYLMGGIKTNLSGQTSMEGLHACGEVACTKSHGANRLASNSLLEGLVYGARVAQSIHQAGKVPLGEFGFNHSPIINNNSIDIQKLRTETVEEVSKSLFIIRKEDQLLKAKQAYQQKLEDLYTAPLSTTYEFETYNIILNAWLMAGFACKRKVSLGSHFVEEV